MGWCFGTSKPVGAIADAPLAVGCRRASFTPATYQTRGSCRVKRVAAVRGHANPGDRGSADPPNAEARAPVKRCRSAPGVRRSTRRKLANGHTRRLACAQCASSIAISCASCSFRSALSGWLPDFLDRLRPAHPAGRFPGARSARVRRGRVPHCQSPEFPGDRPAGWTAAGLLYALTNHARHHELTAIRSAASACGGWPRLTSPSGCSASAATVLPQRVLRCRTARTGRSAFCIAAKPERGSRWSAAWCATSASPTPARTARGTLMPTTSEPPR